MNVTPPPTITSPQQKAQVEYQKRQSKSALSLLDRQPSSESPDTPTRKRRDRKGSNPSSDISPGFGHKVINHMKPKRSRDQKNEATQEFQAEILAKMLDTKNQKATELASKNKDNEAISILKETIKIINKQLEELKINTEDADSPFAEISGKIAAIKDRITELKREGNKKLTSLKERLNGAKELYSQGKFKEAAALITPKDGEDLSVLEHDIKYWLICFRGELHRKKWSLAIDCLAKIPLFSNSPFNADFAQMYDKLKRETISIDNIAEYQLLVILLLLHCKKVNTAIRAFQEITKSNEAHYVLIKNKIKALRPDLYPETE